MECFIMVRPKTPYRRVASGATGNEGRCSHTPRPRPAAGVLRDDPRRASHTLAERTPKSDNRNGSRCPLSRNAAYSGQRRWAAGWHPASYADCKAETDKAVTDSCGVAPRSPTD
jgi:hypothetical protein